MRLEFVAVLMLAGASALARNATPEEVLEVATLAGQIAEFSQAGKYAEAVPVARRLVDAFERAVGPNHSATATGLVILADLHRVLGEYAKAEPLYQRAIKILENTMGPEHQSTGAAINNLATLYHMRHDFQKAVTSFERALRINEKTLGADSVAVAANLNNLAATYRALGDLARAESVYQRAVSILEKAFGAENPQTAAMVSNLAEVKAARGDYSDAEKLFQKALDSREKVFGTDHAEVATALNNFANFYRTTGDYAKAEVLFKRALKIKEEALGPDHPETAAVLDNFAILYDSIGDWANAEPLVRRAITIREKVFGPEHVALAPSLNHLAGIYRRQGAYTKALPLLMKAVQISEKTLGPNHPETATSLGNLASIHQDMGDFDKAERLFQRSMAISEKALGPNHAELATALNNLAELYRAIGNYAKAEPLYRRALNIYEKTLGSNHADAIAVANNLALLCLDNGNLGEARRIIGILSASEQEMLAKILAFTSEDQRLAFQKTLNTYTLRGTLGDPAQLAQSILRYKGIVLDSLLEDILTAQASVDPKQREAVAELRRSKQRLIQSILQFPKDPSEIAAKRHESERRELMKRIEELEGGLARGITGLSTTRRALGVTVSRVQTTLMKDQALVELIRYRHYMGNGKFEPRYGAVFILASGEPKWIPLGSAADIEKNVQLYRKSARGETDEATLNAVLKTLGDQLWVPIEKAFPAGITTVIVSPDAELSFVSFATLLTPDDRFNGEKYSIRYVASGRDLLRETKPVAGPKTTVRVFANPDFALNNEVRRAEKTNEFVLRSFEMRDLQSISLSNLPGTARESAELEARAKKFGWQAQASLGPSATEAELRKVNSPRILHLATHGFFLPEIELGLQSNDLSRAAGDIPKGRLVNAMHRSGIALAGAQTTLQAWSKSNVPPTENDGIVTAEEVGGLKLDDTWLVVLSACDTGSGEAKAGEGVMGLRRGFVQAGSQNLLMTLWSISDETTVQIMLDFYDAAFKTGNAPKALADTQRDWLVKLRKERGLLPAVQLAGPFIMSSQGKP
jgi:tetratricopeptide (TPR) repeat protein